MKITSYAGLVLMGALCLSFGSTASATDVKKSPAKAKSSDKTVAAVPARQPDQVIYVKTTGSLVPQRYIVRDGRILNTATNTQILLLSELTTTPGTEVSAILVNNVPDIVRRGVR